MRPFRLVIFSLTLIAFLISNHLFAQAKQGKKVRWMTFEEMESAFAEAPKHVFIDFWADWCGACKRMDKYVFSNPEIVNYLNTNFYSVKMNAETRDTINFGGKEFKNPTSDSNRTGFHELAILLGKNRDGQFSLPTFVIYDSGFQPVRKFHKYQNSRKLLNALVMSTN